MKRTQWWWLACALALSIGCNGPPPVVDDDAGLPVEDLGNPFADTGNPLVDTGPPACSDGLTRCGDQCIDLQGNNDNCGSCGNACQSPGVCSAGQCATPMDCPAGQTRCGERCVDTTSDNANCGSCGNACPSDQSCSAGFCAAACPSGQVTCGGVCVDTQADLNNCGSCGNACGPGSSCTAGTCMVTIMCPAGQTACAGACVTTATDLNNCGSCGNACAAGQTCTAGTCMAQACPMGQTDCGGRCVDAQTDRNNCGACGLSCAAGQTCTAGMCGGMTSCPAGQTRCGDQCVDTNSDNNNCGRCAGMCAAGQVCTSGQCMTPAMECPMGQTRCGSTCVDLNTTNTHCGRCNNACSTGTTCQMGVCACAAGQTLCGRDCVNTSTSTAHCGACGVACATGQTCQGGTCRGSTCPSGQTDCNGTCVNLQTSAAHCGMCDRACAVGTTCQMGTCGCAAGQMMCAGRCVNLQTDNANCGLCGTACANGTTCQMGRCACPTGQTLCGSRCVNLQTDPLHCGMCSRACAAGTACQTGTCRGMAPANDTRAGATVINLAQPSQTLAADTTNARNDTTGTCGCTSGNDVFYRFVLTTPELVYADTIGATWDTSLFLQSSTGANITAAGTTGGIACNDDYGLCPTSGTGSIGRQSQIMARLGPGTYFLVLSGCGVGTAQIRFQHLPAGNGPSTRIAPSATQQTVTGTTSGTGTVTASCCSGGADNSHWWVTCPGDTGGPFFASSCGTTTAFDIELDQRSAGRTGVSVCNDDTGFVCGRGSTLNSTLPTGPGLHNLIVDACSGSGAYQVRYALGTCAAGQTRCGTCVNTQTDNNNCGGCNRQCATGQFCRGGQCLAPPANDTRTGATVINLTAPSQLLSANTTNARNDTAGTCGCTSGNDVFYRFVLTRDEIVYADTVGASWDTSLFFQSSTGANLTAANLTNGLVCNDDNGLSGCATARQSQVMARFAPGTYHLVLSGCGSGSAQIRFQHLPTGNGTVSLLTAGAGRLLSGTTSGTGRVTSTACTAAGPENTYYWYTCQGAAAGSFTATTCGRASWDTSLHQSSAGRTSLSLCNDDACGVQSSLSAAIPAGPGLHTFYVDGFSATARGAYSVLITRP